MTKRLHELTSTESKDLLWLVDHNETVASQDTVDHVQTVFTERKHNYLAVTDQGKLLGLCSRAQIGSLLGSRYGFSIYGRRPISQHLLEQHLRVLYTTPLLQLLEAALSRTGEAFHDEVALVDLAGQFRGLIGVQTLVHVQSQILSDKVALAQAQLAQIQAQDEALRKSEEHLKSILDSVRAGILVLDAGTGEILDANAFALELMGAEHASLLGRPRHDFQGSAKDGPRPSNESHARLNSTESILLKPNGETVPILRSVVPISGGGRALLLESFIDITEQKKAETELRALHQQLLETSRHAGMAEVATGVLHNVGNVLNSVNVSATLVADRIRRSPLATLAQVAGLLSQHQADLGAYLTHDPKGRLVPDYMRELAKHQAQERETLSTELDLLRKNIEHIKDIVAMQQNYAKVSGVVERMPAAQIVEDALQMNGAALDRHGVKVVREFEENLWLFTDKHKVLQILVNLIRNAKYAMREKGEQFEKRLVVKIARSNPQRATIVLRDNGVGIKPEHLARIFSHGFTTKKDGHGFGLHMGALAAKEMGGSLSAQSQGPGTGATFTLELPLAEENGRAKTLHPGSEKLKVEATAGR